MLGAGSWGTTFAKVLADGGASVAIWARRAELAREIMQSRRNSDYLPGINLPRGIQSSTRLPEVLEGAEQVYLSVPSQSLRENLRIVRDLIPSDALIVSLMKGVEKGTRFRMSEVIHQELGIDPGTDRRRLRARTSRSRSPKSSRPPQSSRRSSLDTATAVARTATNPYFRSFVNTDVIGTEFGGVLKNLIAVAIGIVDGVGYGENTKASIITRGLVEMTDFAVAFGGRAETLAGLAGLGDLIATCESPLSRNNTAGRLLGQGYAYGEVIAQMNQTAEGLGSVAPILELAAKHGVEMPIVSQVAEVLAGTLNPRDIAPHLTTETNEPQGE